MCFMLHNVNSNVLYMRTKKKEFFFTKEIQETNVIIHIIVNQQIRAKMCLLYLAKEKVLRDAVISLMCFII